MGYTRNVFAVFAVFAESCQGKSVLDAAKRTRLNANKVYVEDLATVNLNLALLKEYAFCLKLIVLIVPQLEYFVLFEYSVYVVAICVSLHFKLLQVNIVR
jgi:hypothetical protein